MKSKNYERILIGRVDDGTFTIDSEGRVWRHFQFHGKRPGVYIPVPTRRAEVPAGKGYLRIKFVLDGRKVSVFAHRLVWQLFYGDIPDELEINHIDGVKSNNRPSNLELITSSGNTIHAYRVIHTLDHKGEKHPQRILTDEQVRWIRREYAERSYFGKISEMARTLGVVSNTVRYVIIGKTWRHVV